MNKTALLTVLMLPLLAVSGCSCFCGSCRTAASSEARAAMVGSDAPADGFVDAYFEYNSSALSGDAQEALKQSADEILRNPEAKVLVEGHCDERGTEEYNLALGERRAQEAADFLRNLGVNSDQIKTVSYGESKPFALGSTEEAWAQNRRVHFTPAQ